MNTFGYEEFVHIYRENREDNDENSKKCTFIGYKDNYFGYLLGDYEKSQNH